MNLLSLLNHPLSRSHRDEIVRLRGTKSSLDRQPDPAPAAEPEPVALTEPIPADPIDPAVREYLSNLVSMMRLMADLGYTTEQARRGLAAGHRAGLRELITYSPALALAVADGSRDSIAEAEVTLSRAPRRPTKERCPVKVAKTFLLRDATPAGRPHARPTGRGKVGTGRCFPILGKSVLAAMDAQ